ncbi:MAG TPA: hypothetical protein VK130_08070 [Steroidobacteraceae bacterium]|nr:hypothetical protein [Steroidobacteraceae bacterium]
MVLLAATTACACTTLATNPPPLGAALAGQWQQDNGASDNFEAKLTPLLETQRRRMLPRHGAAEAAGSRRGGEGDSGGTGDRTRDGILPLFIPPEEPEKVRARLGDQLRPPEALTIAIDGEALELTPDTEPLRRFLPGQDVSRIDSSGTAVLDSGWDQRAFVVRARYTNNSTRSWRYEVEAASGLLRVSFEANAPEFGRFSLQTRYRRASPAPAGKH